MSSAAPTRLYKRFAAEGVIAAAYKAKTITILRINSGFIRCLYRCFEVCDVRTNSLPADFPSITRLFTLFVDVGILNADSPYLVSTDQYQEWILAFIGRSY